MKPWTEDAIEQIATAQLLNAANTNTGERLALIICDNAVEYMMIAYVEMEKQLVHKVINPPLWETTKRSYHKLLTFAAAQEPKFAAHQSDIQSFHNTRNDLYHTGTPITVKPAHVIKYLDIAKEVVDILFGVKLSGSDWDKKVAVLKEAFVGKSGGVVKAAATISVTSGGVQVETSATLKTSETLCLVIDSFISKLGREPTSGELEQSLLLSHAAHLSGQNLSKRIHDARKAGLVQKNRLALTDRGRKLVASLTFRV